MANANWSNPQLTSTYTNFVSEVKNRDEDLALQFDGTTSTNIPTNTIRWDSSAGRWKKWNGTSWAELTATYALTGLSTTGAASIGTTLGVTGAITGSSTVTGTALIPSGSSVPVNGIYLPSANSVAISTNSSQRLAIDSSGNITIPGTLAVTGAITGSSTITSAAGSATAAGIQVGTGTTYKPGIYSPGTDQLALATGGSGRVFVNSSGQVSIGTATATRPLTVEGIVPAARFKNTGGQNVVELSGSTTTNSMYLGMVGDDLTVAPSGTEAFRFTSAGRVGIGTSSPSGNLDVYGSSVAVILRDLASATTDSGPILQLQGYTSGTTAPTNFAYIKAGKSNSTAGDASGYLSFYTNPNGTITERLRIDASGRVGIGTTSPSQALSVAGNITSTGSISSAGNIASSAIGTNFVASSSQGVTTTYLITDTSGANIQVDGAWPIRFTTNSGERARIDSSGRLLVGTSSSSSDARLLVQGRGTDSTAQGSLYIQRGGTGSGAGGPGSGIGEIILAGSDATQFASIKCDTDAATGTNNYPGRLVFSTTASGSASPTERFRISSDGSFSSVIPGGSTLYPRFDCRAWVNFNGTTASPSTIRGSGNVSSVTKNGTGDYTINLSTAMPDANYAWSGNACYSALHQTMVYRSDLSHTYSTTALRIQCIAQNGSSDNVSDASVIGIKIFR